MTKGAVREHYYKNIASHPRAGVAVIFDLSGFSKFFNMPDLQSYIPRYLNFIFEVVESAFTGGPTKWSEAPLLPLPILPAHRKFLGDGALYLFVDEEEKFNSGKFLINLSNRLWSIQDKFDDITKQCYEFMPVKALPKKIKFGLSKGSVYELQAADGGQSEYIGVCVNLAARLQKYCDGLNFIASARLDFGPGTLKRHSYMKVVAKELKGFEEEILIVDSDEFDKLESSLRERLFEVLP